MQFVTCSLQLADGIMLVWAKPSKACSTLWLRWRVRQAVLAPRVTFLATVDTVAWTTLSARAISIVAALACSASRLGYWGNIFGNSL